MEITTTEGRSMAPRIKVWITRRPGKVTLAGHIWAGRLDKGFNLTARRSGLSFQVV
jgi:hypothetical protein